MNKLMGGLALGLALCVAENAFAQDDPFAVPSPESIAEESRSLYLEVPPAQPDEPQSQPIIQALPVEQVERVEEPTPRVSQRPLTSGTLTSRPQNAHVRQTRTAAQEYIYQRAVYRAKQRTDRIEQRKWRGESVLRPAGTPADLSWYNQTYLPAWGGDYTRLR